LRIARLAEVRQTATIEGQFIPGSDLKRLTSVADFAYRAVVDSGKLRRACERWPLLAALRSVLGDDVSAPLSAGPTQEAAGAAALWRDA
jgi:hypothetical protein